MILIQFYTFFTFRLLLQYFLTIMLVISIKVNLVTKLCKIRISFYEKEKKFDDLQKNGILERKGFLEFCTLIITSKMKVCFCNAFKNDICVTKM